MPPPSEPTLPSVLHVVESYGGGIVSALNSYIESSPNLEHHLLYSPREEALGPRSVNTRFSSITVMPSQPYYAIREIRKVVKELKPSFVHSHSSFGGLFTRLALRNKKARPIIYTPHGFSFERRDVNWPTKTLFWLAELALSINTQTIAACAPRELDLARKLLARATIYLPNVGRLPSASAELKYPKVRDQQIVVTVGRITNARDPNFYLSLVEQLHHLTDLRFVWVGDGDEVWRKNFASAGVEITGWLSPREVEARLLDADFFLHTGAWDGFPMALLEAHQAGLTLFVRASKSLSLAPGARSTPKDLASHMEKLIVEPDPVLLSSYKAAWCNYLAANNQVSQSTALRSIYTKQL